MNHQEIKLQLSLEEFQDTTENNDWSSLLAHVIINGVSHHLEAIEVEKVGGLQEAKNPAWDLDVYSHAFEGDGPFLVTRINGRDYVLLMSPYRGTNQ